jgi:hypothetical protein
MAIRTVCFLCVVICWSLVGCAGSTSRPSNGGVSGNEAKPSLLGKWSSSTSPDLAVSATSMKFLVSGEWQFSGPLLIGGKPATAKIDGKDQPVPLTASGTWELKDDQLGVSITQTNVPSFKAEPWTYKVVEVTDRKLVLDKEGEKTTLFRIE